MVCIFWLSKRSDLQSSPVPTGPEGKSSCAQKSLHFLFLFVFLPLYLCPLTFSQPCHTVISIAVEMILNSSSGNNGTKNMSMLNDFGKCIITEEQAGIVVQS